MFFVAKVLKTCEGCERRERKIEVVDEILGFVYLDILLIFCCLFFQFVFLSWAVVGFVHAHGYMSSPAARNSAWRFGFDVAADYNDNELSCGGRGVSPTRQRWSFFGKSRNEICDLATVWGVLGSVLFAICCRCSTTSTAVGAACAGTTGGCRSLDPTSEAVASVAASSPPTTARARSSP